MPKKNAPFATGHMDETASIPAHGQVGEATLAVAEFWDEHIPRLLEAHGRDTGLGELSATVAFHVEGRFADAATWTVVLDRGHLRSVSRGRADGATTSVQISTDDFLGIATGRLDYREPFFAGRIRADGDIELLLWAASLIPILIDRFPWMPSNSRAES
jgi:hypothetical protein